jgi:hypothetical protein
MLAVVLAAAMALGGCAWGDPDSQYPEANRGDKKPRYEPEPSIFGPGGIALFGGGGGDTTDEDGGGIGVNSFLWRASLDTISFMPLVSADPFGGVIITDWYSPPEAPDERLKVNVFILGRELRADGVRATVFRQRRELSGAWVDAPVAPETAASLEDAILTRARQLRVASAGG